MADCISFFNGDWIPTEECKLDVFDRGLLMGDAVVDVARTYNGKPFKIERHFDRMQRSLKYARLDIGMTMDEFGKIIIEAVERNQKHIPEVGDLIIWFFATRGKGPWACPPQTTGPSPQASSAGSWLPSAGSGKRDDCRGNTNQA